MTATRTRTGTRYVRPHTGLTERLGEILRFLIEYSNEKGLKLNELGSDYRMGLILNDAFGFHKETGRRFVEKLRAAGCLGNPSDERQTIIQDQRRGVFMEIDRYLRDMTAGRTITGADVGDMDRLRARIAEVL
jgi:hypothetical protein